MTAPYSGLPFPQPGQSLQRERRVWREFTDQHGRVFGAQSDMATNQPIGEIMPQGFQAPWLPPMRFVKFSKVGDLKFRWDYTTMANELAGDTDVYYRDAVTFALENHKPEPEVGGPVDRSIRFVLGKPPLSAAIPLAAEMGDPWLLGIPGAAVNTNLKAILEQTEGGNAREVLAELRARLQAQATDANVPLVQSAPVVAEKPVVERTINTVDIKDLPTVTYKEFLAACLSRGMKMPDAALAWQEHKRLMQESEAAA